MTKKTETNSMTIRGLEIAIGDGAVSKAVNLAIKASSNYRSILHVALVSAVAHAIEYRDTTLLSKLYAGLGNETNKGKGIATWLRAHTNLIYTETKTADGQKTGIYQWLKPKSNPNVELYNLDAEGKPVVTVAKARIPVNLGDWQAIDVPFYNMVQVAKDNEVPELVNMIEAFFTKVNSMVKQGKITKPVDLARIEFLQKAKDQFSTEEAGKFATLAAQEG